ncbi:fimbrial biogenesis chaperone [Erwinia sorbitola]|uniref:Fimbria/pilus periplasmic chaperone n=1 Tax=Erwinia sorbitola TaxID=2681984 RepID=A0ABW9RBK8_9GAMM|nr:molecular chaperone [Erwinia sorbitola]MTD27442.1 fimbria/pilus periplasmic chaperone [Erwinia sorbitola]
MRKYLLLLLLLPGLCSANVIISATRAIYLSEKKEIAVQLLNDGADPSLVQAWIDNGNPDSTPETAKVPFLLMPPVVKVPAHGGQQLRVKYLGNIPIQDRESVYYLNVLDIPPVPENLQGKNVMQLAIRSRIKLFFRPAGLKITLNDMISHLTLTAMNKSILIHNASPYYLTLSALRAGKENLLSEGLMVAPFSQTTLAVKGSVTRGMPLSVVYLNDYGASIESKKNAQ